jgi:DNA processing protein
MALASLSPAPASVLRELVEQGIRTLSYGHPDYPRSLTDLPDPPPIIHLRGSGIPTLDRCVAIVGTRSATSYGRELAERIASRLARYGWVVVSGMARGIDASAHRAALDGGGLSIGVLGSGLNFEFPSSNRPLYRQMRERGLLVSEFPPDQPPAAGCFPRRNRLIAALARAVVVVQAGRRSGALITAGHALDLGRDVFAVPGPVGLRASVGVNELLRDGAGVVTCAEDVLEGLGWSRPDGWSETCVDRDETPASLGAPARCILERLARGSCGVDDLAVASGLETGSALALLSRLELDGWLVSRPGGRFERAELRPVGLGRGVEPS